MLQTTTTSTQKPGSFETRSLILAHFRNRPLSLHFTAWMLVGISFGILLAPNLQWASVFGFGLSGCIFCGILALMTYPLSENYRLIVAGAMGGLTMIPLCNLMAPEQMSNVGPPLCLMIGALIGATGLIWLSPLRLWNRWQSQQAGR